MSLIDIPSPRAFRSAPLRYRLKCYTISAWQLNERPRRVGVAANTEVEAIRPPENGERAVDILFANPAFQGAFWSGLIQLGVLTVAALFGNLVYRRMRDRAVARQALLSAIHQFTVDLYKPRKFYQICVEPSVHGGHPNATIHDANRRSEIRARMLEEFIDVVGQFRSLQTSMVELFGHDRRLFGYYLAIWAQLKEVRAQMEAGLPLVEHVAPDARDPMYRLFDDFHGAVQRARCAWSVLGWRGSLWPSPTELAAMREEASRIQAQINSSAEPTVAHQIAAGGGHSHVETHQSS